MKLSEWFDLFAFNYSFLIIIREHLDLRLITIKIKICSIYFKFIVKKIFELFK